VRKGFSNGSLSQRREGAYIRKRPAERRPEVAMFESVTGFGTIKFVKEGGFGDTGEDGNHRTFCGKRSKWTGSALQWPGKKLLT